MDIFPPPVLSVRQGAQQMVLKSEDLSEGLGDYLKKSNVNELNVNIGACYAGNCSSGTSFLDEFGQGLADKN